MRTTLLVGLVAICFGLGIWSVITFTRPPVEANVPGGNGEAKEKAVIVAGGIEEVSAQQKELDGLVQTLHTTLKAENRLNLSMTSQLRAQLSMLKSVQSYAKKVEDQVAGIQEMSKGQFQDDVKLQAALFNGKGAKIVAKHLEEFRPNRVGAILANMEQEEASNVLDIWAQQTDKRTSDFYRSVMTSFLMNRRYQTSPEAFSQILTNKSSSAEPVASQSPAPKL